MSAIHASGTEAIEARIEFSEAHKDMAVLRCTSFQGRNRDTDIENGHVAMVGEGEGGMN